MKEMKKTNQSRQNRENNTDTTRARTKTKKGIIGAAVFIALCAAAVGVYAVSCAVIQPSVLDIPEKGTVIYDANGDVYTVLQRFGRRGTECPDRNTAVRFAGNKLRSDLSNDMLVPLGLGEKSVSRLLAENILPLGTGESEITAAARYLEQKFPDDAELAVYYASSAQFGEGIYGLDRAAKYYFLKRAQELNLVELGILRRIASDRALRYSSPDIIVSAVSSGNAYFSDMRGFTITDGSAYTAALCGQVKEKLLSCGYTAAQASELLYTGGMRIYSCIQPNIQSAAEMAIRSLPQSQAQMAMAICDENGNVCAVIGGIDRGGLVDRSRVPHAIGSSIKPLSVYAPAIDAGIITYSSLLPDVPFEEATLWPKNFDGINEGQVTTAKAVRRSKNTCAVHVADKLGINRCAAFLKSLGFGELSPQDMNYTALALGYLDEGISVTGLCAAYRIFPSGGVYREPSYFTKIEDEQGGIVCTGDTEEIRIISPQTAYIMERMLISNVEMEEGLGKGARISGTEVFGKTGTTDNVYGTVNNHVFAGGIPGYTGVIWIGLDDSQSAAEINGMPSVTKVWRSVFEQFAQEGSFPSAENVSEALFCTESGLLAADGCKETETGWFADGTLPEKCSSH